MSWTQVSGPKVTLSGAGTAKPSFTFPVMALPTNDLPFVLFLPSYATTAWYHKQLPADLQAKPLRDVLSEVEHWTSTEYQDLLAKGNEAQAVKRYRELTGAGIVEAQSAIRDAQGDG